MERYESRCEFKYEWVIRTRPDLMLKRPLPPLDSRWDPIQRNFLSSLKRLYFLSFEALKIQTSRSK